VATIASLVKSSIRSYSNKFSEPVSSGLFEEDSVFASAEDKKAKLEKQFEWFTEALDKYGVYSGTGHKRILIPKKIINKEELGQLGFLPVQIAIPETGQLSSESFRHLDLKHHLHEFKENWTIHEDEHHSSTMLVEKAKRQKSDFVDTAGKFIAGLPHVITEGIPGLYYYAKGKIQGKTATMEERLMGELPYEYLDYIDEYSTEVQNTLKDRYDSTVKVAKTGFDNIYNTIEGLRHGGMAEHTRKKLTDFGSGYQGENKEKTKQFSFVGAGAAGISGFGAYKGISKLIYPFSKKEMSRYPELKRMRKIGTKHGLRTYDPFAFKDFTGINRKKLKPVARGTMNLLFGPINPTSSLGDVKGFKGLTYVHSGSEKIEEIAKHGLNVGNWDIGNDKLATWELLKKRGISNLHIETMPAGEFFIGDEAAEEFLERAGGSLENIVLKKNYAALGKGVWLNMDKVPMDIQEEVAWNPTKYLVQPKIDIAEEYRVVTAGGLPIHTTYRFGSPKTRETIKKFGYTAMKDLADKGEFKGNPFEIIEPVFDKKMKQRLEKFASKASVYLPYEISALDIALTKQGELKIVEAQRSFGNISNPLVGSRLKYALTNKKSKLSMAVAGLTAGVAAVLGYNIFSGSDDEHNTIEGLRHGGMAENTRKKLTEFGSGWRRLLNTVGKVFRKKKPSLKNIIKQEDITVVKTIEEYVSAVAGKGASKEAIATHAERLRLAGPLSFVEGRTVYPGNVKMFAFDVLKEGGIKYGSKKYSRYTKTLEEIGLYHEIAEVKYGTRVKKAFGSDPAELAKMKFGSHWSPQVIKEEAKYAKQLGKEGMEVAALLRKSEGIDVYGPVRPEQMMNTVKELRRVQSKIRKGGGGVLVEQQRALKKQYYQQKTAMIYGEVFNNVKLKSNKSINKGLKKGDSYNSKPGLHPGAKNSLGARSIKDISDFGSKYDAVKGLAKALGQNTDDLIKSKMFQESLRQGKRVKKLGEGGFGETWQYETVVGGQKFSYARKEILESTRKNFGDIPMIMEPIEKSFITEVKALKQTGRHGITPTAYGSDKDILYMELMSGKDAFQLINKQGISLPDSAIAEARREAKEMAKKGVLHKDIAHRNIMWDKGKGRVAIIDLGVSDVVKNPNTEWVKNAMQSVDNQFDKLIQVRRDAISHYNKNNPGVAKSDALNFARTKPDFNIAGKTEIDFNLVGKTELAASSMAKTDFAINATARTEVIADAFAKTKVAGNIKPQAAEMISQKTAVGKHIKDPRRTARIKKFRKISTEAVGIGYRTAHNGGRKHRRFSATTK